MISHIRIGACCALFFAGIALSVSVHSTQAAAPGPAIGQTTVDPALPPPEEFVLLPRRVVFFTADGKWDDAETMLDGAFKAIYGALSRQNIRAAGVPMVEYLESDDETFAFRAMVPIDAPVSTTLSPGVQIGDGPAGKVLKFVHRGSFDDLEQVYNRIDDYLASRKLSMQRVVEEYVTDQTVTPSGDMVTNIYIFTE